MFPRAMVPLLMTLRVLSINLVLPDASDTWLNTTIPADDLDDLDMLPYDNLIIPVTERKLKEIGQMYSGVELLEVFILLTREPLIEDLQTIHQHEVIFTTRGDPADTYREANSNPLNWTEIYRVDRTLHHHRPDEVTWDISTMRTPLNRATKRLRAAGCGHEYGSILIQRTTALTGHLQTIITFKGYEKTPPTPGFFWDAIVTDDARPPHSEFLRRYDIPEEQPVVYETCSGQRFNPRH